MINTFKIKPLVAAMLIFNLAACGGSNEKNDDPKQTPIDNSAPTVTSELNFEFSESSEMQTIELLSGAQDINGDNLTVINWHADSSNPAIETVRTANQLTITPSDLTDTLNEGESQTFKFSYQISDGALTVDQQLKIIIKGVSEQTNATQVIVTTALNTLQYYENSAILQRDKFFNMHDSFSKGYTEAVIKLYVDELNINQGRQFWSPIDVATQIAGESNYPETSVAQQQGPANVNSYHANPLTKLTGEQNRTVMTSHPKNNMSVNNNPVEGARWAADYFEHYYDDASLPLIFEPMNEPFVHAWEYQSQYNNSDHETRQHMTKWFKEIGKAIDNRPALKNLNVVGYSAAWPSMELPFNTGKYFAHWESRQKLFMDEAGPYMDGFSVHLYDGINIIDDSVADDTSEIRRSGANAQAILDLIETYSHYKWNTVKPHAITEYGNIVDRAPNEVDYNETVNSQTMRSINNILMELLAREDRILTSIPFIAGYTTWYWQDPNSGNGQPYNPSMWRPDPEKIQLNADTNKWEFKNPQDPDNYLLTKNHLFYAFWKDVKGHRLAISSPDPDVQTAAYAYNDKAYLIINNLADEVKDIQLDINALTGFNFEAVELERLTVPVNTAATHTSKNLNISGALDGTAHSELAIKLAVGETIKFTLDLDKNVPIDQTLQRKTYYANEHLQSINANQPIKFNINHVQLTSKDTQPSSAMLRMGLGRAHTGSKQPIVKINGTQITVPENWAGYDQKNRKEGFFGAIDIPVPYELIAEDNEITLTFPDDGGKVSSLILEVNNQIDNLVITEIKVNENQILKIGKTFQATSQVLPDHAPNKTISWVSSNEAVARVDNQGLVTAVSQGTAEITANSHNGLSSSFILTVPKADANLLADLNTDFEDGDITPWGKFWQTDLTSQFDVTNDAAKTGNYGLQVNISNDDKPNGISLSRNTLPQIFGENQNRQFMLMFDIKINSSELASIPMKFFMVPRNDSTGKDEWSSRIEKSISVNNTTGWQTIELQFDEANWGEHLARMELYFSAQSGAIDAHVDNIQIKILE